MEERTFGQVINGIENAEKDVDRVLKAARLKRHEMSDKRFEAVMDTLTMVGMYVFAIVAMLIMALAR